MSQAIKEVHGYAMVAPGTTPDSVGKGRGQDIDEDGNNPGLPIFSYYEQHVSTTNTHVYLSQNIGAPAAYIQLVQFFNARQSGDVVHVHFNCYGGRLDAGIQLLTAMQNCQAQIVGHLDSVAYSMAALMFLQCDAHYVSPYAKLMLHTYSGGGGGGKGPDQRAAQDSIEDTYARLVQNICVPFLSKREVKDMLENMRDMYFGYDEIVDRMTPKEKAKVVKRVKPTADLVNPDPDDVTEVHGGLAVPEDEPLPDETFDEGEPNETE